MTRDEYPLDLIHVVGADLQHLLHPQHLPCAAVPDLVPDHELAAIDPDIDQEAALVIVHDLGGQWGVGEAA